MCTEQYNRTSCICYPDNKLTHHELKRKNSRETQGSNCSKAHVSEDEKEGKKNLFQDGGEAGWSTTKNRHS